MQQNPRKVPQNVSREQTINHETVPEGNRGAGVKATVSYKLLLSKICRSS
jgi:hypothetical protein